MSADAVVAAVAHNRCSLLNDIVHEARLLVVAGAHVCGIKRGGAAEHACQLVSGEVNGVASHALRTGAAQ